MPMVNNECSESDVLAALYSRHFGVSPCSCERLPGAGSDRRYYRLAGVPVCGGSRETAIGVLGSDRRENIAFVALSEMFGKQGMNVPEVYEVADDGMAYLQEDLGDVSLFGMLGGEAAGQLVAECMRSLARMQCVPREEWENRVMCRPFGRRLVMWDLNYFKYEFLKPLSLTFDEDALEDDFERMADALAGVPDDLCGFMYRDCQSRNVMVRDGEPWWIDFQGGRLGPCVYDAVSFLWQAKAGFDASFRERMLRVYCEEFSRLRGVDGSRIAALAGPFALFRTLQVLGAYGFRGLIEHRAHFIESIPGAVGNLRSLLGAGMLSAYPALENVCRRIVADGRFGSGDEGGLTVTVFSFSYKRGYPADYSGNGGGYMFDCRALHNPGRYDMYRSLTGLDAPVRTFLEDRGEVQPYLEAAWHMTDQAVERYLRRGFTRLQIGFGCTGGRHRSVYCADITARHLAGLFPEARIRVVHREQGIEEDL